MLLNPRVLVEVVSPTTEAYDRGTKMRHYPKIPSLMEILLVAQREAFVEHYVRQSDGNWLRHMLEGMGGIVELNSIQYRLTMPQIYEGVSFPPLSLLDDDRAAL